MSAVAQTHFSGLRVLIVEDGVFTAMALKELLTESGCDVVGPCPDLEEAIGIARSAQIDVAVLDIDIEGRPVYGVADELQRRGIPFIFASGYDKSRTPERLANAISLEKPFDNDELLEALQSAVVGKQYAATATV
jgi:DNA-binding NarL/FixJ family response regulator